MKTVIREHELLFKDMYITFMERVHSVNVIMLRLRWPWCSEMSAHLHMVWFIRLSWENTIFYANFAKVNMLPYVTLVTSNYKDIGGDKDAHLTWQTSFKESLFTAFIMRSSEIIDKNSVANHMTCQDQSFHVHPH